MYFKNHRRLVSTTSRRKLVALPCESPASQSITKISNFLEYSINMLKIYEIYTKKLLKVPKCEIFDRSDFHDFYSIKPFWVGDFGAKI